MLLKLDINSDNDIKIEITTSNLERANPPSKMIGNLLIMFKTNDDIFMQFSQEINKHFGQAVLISALDYVINILPLGYSVMNDTNIELILSEIPIVSPIILNSKSGKHQN